MTWGVAITAVIYAWLWPHSEHAATRSLQGRARRRLRTLRHRSRQLCSDCDESGVRLSRAGWRGMVAGAQRRAAARRSAASPAGAVIGGQHRAAAAAARQLGIDRRAPITAEFARPRQPEALAMSVYAASLRRSACSHCHVDGDWTAGNRSARTRWCARIGADLSIWIPTYFDSRDRARRAPSATCATRGGRSSSARRIEETLRMSRTVLASIALIACRGRRLLEAAASTTSSSATARSTTAPAPPAKSGDVAILDDRIAALGDLGARARTRGGRRDRARRRARLHQHAQPLRDVAHRGRPLAGRRCGRASRSRCSARARWGR